MLVNYTNGRFNVGQPKDWLLICIYLVMAYDEYLADRTRRIFKDLGAMTIEKKMMGGLVFMVDDKMCVGLDKDKKSAEDRLMARIGPEVYEAALKEKGSRKMDFTGKPMKGFVYIYSDGIDTDEDLEYWLVKALEFNRFAKKSKK